MIGNWFLVLNSGLPIDMQCMWMGLVFYVDVTSNFTRKMQPHGTKSQNLKGWNKVTLNLVLFWFSYDGENHFKNGKHP